MHSVPMTSVTKVGPTSQIDIGESLSSVAVVKKHNRRNTEPIQSGSFRSSSTSTTTASWGSMFDFSSIFFPSKKSKPYRGHVDRAGSVNPFSYDFNIRMSSPSTTSCSGDEDYDSSSSSSSGSQAGEHPIAHQSVMGDSKSLGNNENSTTQYDSPISFFRADRCSSYNDGNDASINGHVVSTKTDAIAERWISMASTAFPEPLTPLHTPNQYYCKNSVNCAVPSVALNGDWDHSDDLDHSPYQHHYHIVNDSPSYVTQTMSTPRYTNDNRNFRYGTQYASMFQNVHTGNSEQSEQHTRSNSSTSTNEQQPRDFITQEEYTTHESTSSREHDQLNERQSNTSFQQATASRVGGNPHNSESSNGNMSDDDEDAYQSSDEDDDNESLSDAEDDEEEEKLRLEATLWKTAADPKSGRTYYYNTKTLETQWRKPLCCASPSERRAAIKKERQTLAFFASMEQNILCSIQQQQQQQHRSVGDGPSQRHHSMIETSPRMTNDHAAPQHRRESEPPSSFQNPFKLIRTISSMEDSVLAALVQRVPSFRHTTSSSKRNLVGSGSVFTSYSQQHDTSADVNINDSSSNANNNENTSGTVQRLAVREDSLPFGALMDAARSQRRVGLDTNDGSSFSFSALMRMNSQHNSRFNAFDYIPEGENEDNSESCSNHFESSELSPLRGNKSLTRQGGFINLNKSGCFLSSEDLNENLNEDEDDDEELIEDPINHVSYRDNLRRTNGSLALRVELPDNTKEPITRENSLNLAEIAGTRQIKRDSSIALHDGEQWGSYLSETALQGLSVDESEAMLELASITDRMGGIHSDTSDSSDNSVEDSKVSAENIEPRFNTSSSAVNEWNGVNSSGEFGFHATPELFADKPPRRESNISSRPSMIRPTSLRNTPAALILETVTTKSKAMEKPSILRRNTCGTLYVGSTLSAPDKDATIKCVCAVYRAHILQSTIEDDELDLKYKVFDDMSSKADDTKQGVLVLPTLDDVSVFYRDVFSRAQMESDCIIISLIYVERLIKVTEGALRPRISNWRSILFSCMVMASKVWDDLSMWNADFSHTCPAGVEFKLSRINELEIAVLSSLQYKVKVPASEYAKYYFLLRSMLIKSGLGSDDLKAINPLDVEGAKQLQHISSQYQASVALMSDRQKVAMGRSKTTGGSHEIQPQFSVDGSTYSDSSNSSTPLTSPTSEKQQRAKVGLEHMVQL